MNKTEIKNATSNKLIVRLADLNACIVAKNGYRCKTESEELNNVMNELKTRELLTDNDIKWLNM